MSTRELAGKTRESAARYIAKEFVSPLTEAVLWGQDSCYDCLVRLFEPSPVNVVGIIAMWDIKCMQSQRFYCAIRLPQTELASLSEAILKLRLLILIDCRV